MRTVDSLREAVDAAKRREQVMVRCPGHDDNAASLHVAPGDKHPVLMTCHAGCSVETILAVEATYGGITGQDLMAPRDESFVGNEEVWTPAGNASHVYQYVAEDGELLFEVLRVPLPGAAKKTFRQRAPIPGPKPWKWNMDGVRRVLYRLPEVLKAKANGETIFVVEGEKDVETLRSRAGVTATTSPMGAGKWQPEYSEMLAGANIIIIADADSTGRNLARTVIEQLVSLGCSVALREAAGGQKDVTDHFNAGGTLDTLIETMPESAEPKVSYGVDILEAIKRTVSPKSFVIPGVLARGDRLLLTGFEGHGKSTLCQQMAVQAAAGIHWWTGQHIEPQKVVVVDSENHPDQILEKWQNLVGLAARHDRPIQPGMLTIVEAWDDEIDLTSEEGHSWLIERVHAYKPDLMVIGPLYNLSSRDLSEHATVGKIKQVINEARSLYGTAFVMEHHAPHRNPGDTKRSVRPYGSSTFLKWPDFGYGIAPMEQEGIYEWAKTRFPRVRNRQFPSHLRWGVPNSDEWYWMSCIVDEDTGQVIG
jgi:5S rRNA maturation endonuclease (ribonuclease M5)